MISARLARTTLETLEKPQQNIFSSLSFLKEKARSMLDEYMKNLDTSSSAITGISTEPIKYLHSFTLLPEYIQLLKTLEEPEALRLLVSCISGLRSYETHTRGRYTEKDISAILLEVLTRQGINLSRSLLRHINFSHEPAVTESISDVIHGVNESVKRYGSTSPIDSMEFFMYQYPKSIERDVLLQRLQEEKVLVPVLHAGVMKAVEEQKSIVQLIISPIPELTENMVVPILKAKEYRIMSYDISGDGMGPASYQGEPYAYVKFEIPEF